MKPLSPSSVADAFPPAPPLSSAPRAARARLPQGSTGVGDTPHTLSDLLRTFPIAVRVSP